MGIFKKEMWPRWVVGVALFGVGVALAMVAFQECTRVGTDPSEAGGGAEAPKGSSRLAAKTLVKGRVLDMKARPIAGADVEIYCANAAGLWPVGKERTDSQGRFAMEVCDRGLLHILTKKRAYERSHLIRRVPAPKSKKAFSKDAGVS